MHAARDSSGANHPAASASVGHARTQSPQFVQSRSSTTGVSRWGIVPAFPLRHRVRRKKYYTPRVKLPPLCRFARLTRAGAIGAGFGTAGRRLTDLPMMMLRVVGCERRQNRARGVQHAFGVLPFYRLKSNRD